MPISDKLIDQLLEGCDSPDDILGEAGLLKQLTKKVAERALNAEMVMLNMHLKARIPATPETVKPAKKYALFMVKQSWIFLVTEMVALSPSQSKKVKNN